MQGKRQSEWNRLEHLRELYMAFATNLQDPHFEAVHPLSEGKTHQICESLRVPLGGLLPAVAQVWSQLTCTIIRKQPSVKFDYAKPGFTRGYDKKSAPQFAFG